MDGCSKWTCKKLIALLSHPDFYEIAKNIEFLEITRKYGDLQKELKNDLAKLENSKNVIIAADRFSNFCACDVETYRKLRLHNVQNEYKKSILEEVESVNVKSELKKSK